MRSVDAYLSRRAATVWPGAVVTCYDEDRTDWRMTRPGMEIVGLGGSFTEARRALDALIAGHVQETSDAMARVRDRVLEERRATEHLLRVVEGDSDDTYARASDAWHAARRLTDDALGIESEHRQSA